jgi:hypothetical protein
MDIKKVCPLLQGGMNEIASTFPEPGQKPAIV